MTFHAWFLKAIGWPERPEPIIPARPPRGDAAFHVRRFTLALEQCEKGPARRAELQRWLDYWTARQAAEDLHPGAA